MPKSELPDKPSALIRLALEDLEKAEKSKEYKIYMGTWHWPAPDGKTCEVCLAGAVMAFSLSATKDTSLSPYDFEENEDKLRALDAFRCGYVSEGLRYMLGKEVAAPLAKRAITLYSISPESFKRDMQKLASDLEGAKL